MNGNTKQKRATRKAEARGQRPARIVTLSDPVAAADGYLDKVAVAQRLGMKPRTVGEWANQGKLPAYRVGPYLRFKWAEVEVHVAATCRCVPQGPTSKAEPLKAEMLKSGVRRSAETPLRGENL